jgi:hypothetical protein
MNCVELQQSLAEVEDAGRAEQRAHLMACPECSALVTELDLIIVAAGQLQAADEPSPRVWNSIAIALREEGLIRPQPAKRHPVSSFSLQWGSARWLVPAAAILLLSLGIYLRQESVRQPALQQAAVALPTANLAGLDDQDLMQEVAANTPAMKTQYEENLRWVNESIREAQGVVDESPNDEEARRSLMDAYQQKSMLFEMAMDHPLSQ